ncbi:hypothetical protein, partial [Herbiconiux daphne]
TTTELLFANTLLSYQRQRSDASFMMCLIMASLIVITLTGIVHLWTDGGLSFLLFVAGSITNVFAILFWLNQISDLIKLTKKLKTLDRKVKLGWEYDLYSFDR